MVNPLTLKDRAIAYGIESLTDAEMISMLTRIDPDVLTPTIEAHGLHELFTRRYDLGTTESQRVMLEAVYQVAQRISKARYVPGLEIHGPDAIGQLLMNLLQYSEVEVAKLVLMDSRGKLLRIHDFATGASNAAVILPKDAAMICLRAGCTNCLLAHNHVSGNLEFSPADVQATHQLAEGLALIGIRLVDHVLVGHGEWKSMKKERLY